MLLSEDVLRSLYYGEGLSSRSIAARFGSTHTAVLGRMDWLGIERRSRHNALFGVETNELRHMYLTCGMSEKEIGLWFGVGQAAVKVKLNNVGIPRRMFQYPKGAQAHGWRGDNCTYEGFHERLHRRKGKPDICSQCGSDRFVEWHSKARAYDDLDGYVALCRKCHKLAHEAEFFEEHKAEGITVREAAIRIGVCAETVKRRLRDGELSGYKIGQRWLIPWPEFRRLKERKEAI